MSDSSWVRLFAGQRCRTPTRPKSPPFPSPTALVVGNSYFGGDNPPNDSLGTARLLSPRLVSAHRQNLALAVTGSDLLINEQDRVQQNPMVDQMAEALRIAIMTRPAVATLGPEFTSYVLHLVEGYEALKKQLLEMEKRLEQVNTLRKQDAEDLRTVAERWDNQEMQYKAEIKRLELIIHDTSERGVGAVVLARAGSLIRRNRPVGEDGTTQEESDKLTPVGREGASKRDPYERERHGKTRDGDQYSILTRRRILNPQNDIEMSERIRQLSGAAGASDGHFKLTDRQHRPAQGCPHSRAAVSSPSPSSSSSPFSCSSLSSESPGGGDEQCTAQIMSVITIQTDPSPPSGKNDGAHIHCGGRRDLEEKEDCANSGQGPILPTSEPSSAGKSRHRREFSFAPGDDSLELVRRGMPGAVALTKVEAAL